MFFIIVFQEHESAPGLSGLCACRSRPIYVQNDVKLDIYSFVEGGIFLKKTCKKINKRGGWKCTWRMDFFFKISKCDFTFIRESTSFGT